MLQDPLRRLALGDDLPLPWLGDLLWNELPMRLADDHHLLSHHLLDLTVELLFLSLSDLEELHILPLLLLGGYFDLLVLL